MLLQTLSGDTFAAKMCPTHIPSRKILRLHRHHRLLSLNSQQHPAAIPPRAHPQVLLTIMLPHAYPQALFVHATSLPTHTTTRYVWTCNPSSVDDHVSFLLSSLPCMLATLTHMTNNIVPSPSCCARTCRPSFMDDNVLSLPLSPLCTLAIPTHTTNATLSSSCHAHSHKSSIDDHILSPLPSLPYTLAIPLRQRLAATTTYARQSTTSHHHVVIHAQQAPSRCRITMHAPSCRRITICA